MRAEKIFIIYEKNMQCVSKNDHLFYKDNQALKKLNKYFKRLIRHLNIFKCVQKKMTVYQKNVRFVFEKC